MGFNYRSLIFWIVIGTFALYLIPTVVAVLGGAPIMPEFYPVTVSYPYAVISIYIAVLVLLLILVAIAPAMGLRPVKIRVPRVVFNIMIAAYLVTGFSCFAYMFTKLGIADMLMALGGGRIGAAKFIYNNIASQLNELNLLKYYFLSSTAIIGFYTLFYYKPRLLILSLSVLALIYILISRREIILFIVSLILVNPHVKKTWKFSLAILAIVAFFVIVVIRVADYSTQSNILYDYYSSQELYPYQFGAYLIDRFLAGQIKIGLEGIGFNTTLAGFEQARFFNFNGFGPTVGIAYPFIRTGLFLPSLYMIFYFSLLKTVGLLSKKDRAYKVVLIYLAIKLFVLLRNGEFVTNFVDILLFFVIVLPFIAVSAPRQQSQGYIYRLRGSNV